MARRQLGGRLLPPSNSGEQTEAAPRSGEVAAPRPTDSTGQRAYFPLALQVHAAINGSDIGIIWWE